MEFDNHDPGDGTGVYFLGSDGSRGSNLHLEDIYIHHYKDGLVLKGYDGVTMHRCLVTDNYERATGTTKGQGMYGNNMTGFKMSECIFDKNGWNGDRDSSDSGASIFSHNVYLSNGAVNAELTNNIIMNAASHGVQMRGGGTARNNYFYGNPIALLLGGGDSGEVDPDGVLGYALRNVVLKSNDINSNARRGFGIDLKNLREGAIRENIVAHKDSTGWGFAIGKSVSGGPDLHGVQNVDIEDNICYYGGNIYIRPPGPDHAPAVNVNFRRNYNTDVYDLHAGNQVFVEELETMPDFPNVDEDGQVPGFEDQIRSMGKNALTWVTADHLNSKVRAGFGME